ncbi:MAG: hypothetical protein ACXW1W_04385 [Methylococcaceae bacterium]
MYKQNKSAINTLCPAIVLLMLSGVIPVNAAKVADPQELIQQLGIKQEQLKDLNKGEPVPFDVAENTEKELAAGVAIYIPAAPSKLVKFIKQDKLASIDSDVVAQGAITKQAGLDSFKGFGFSSKQAKEAEKFLAAKPGNDFNLSAQEIEAIKAIKVDNAKATRDAASQGYRKILLERFESYSKSGLQGIPTYSRGSGAADPAAELRNATTQNKVLPQYFPDLHKVWLNYPAALPAGAEEKFFWLNRTVEKRPTAVLGHRIILETDAGAVILARQFYVGHSYNSSQLTIGCLPYQDGSLIFYANRTSTDQVAGMGSSLKHSIGREQMRAEIVKRLKKLEKILK